MTPITFETLGLTAPLQRALAERQYATPSPIQVEAIPPLLNGRDVLGCAQTGSGKTAAFTLPILHAMHSRPRNPRPRSARALVLTPTRELAMQVAKSVETYGRYLDLSHAIVYGGVGQGPQVRSLRPGVDFLVGCPGRLLDLIDQGHLDLSGIEYFVLDEVDRMLDMGFHRDVTRIVSLLPKQRQSLFFSATLAPEIVALAQRILRDPVTVTIAPELTTCDSVQQRVCFLDRAHKRALLVELLAAQQERQLAIVFSRTKHGADKLARHLRSAGVDAEAIHGNRTQPQRERTLERFRGGRVPVLVATDVAARGIDVREVSLIINFDLPREPEAYVHRIGRTGRAGAAGHAVSFCAPEEAGLLRDIEKHIRAPLPIDDSHQWHLPALAHPGARRESSGPGREPKAKAKRDSFTGRRPQRRRRRRSRRVAA